MQSPRNAFGQHLIAGLRVVAAQHAKSEAPHGAGQKNADQHGGDDCEDDCKRDLIPKDLRARKTVVVRELRADLIAIPAIRERCE